jgi:hypothetical protein
MSETLLAQRKRGAEAQETASSTSPQPSKRQRISSDSEEQVGPGVWCRSTPAGSRNNGARPR